METVSIGYIKADINQPRKNFDPVKLKALQESIKAHGIINPIVVEKVGANKYIIVDGERRFRAAQEAGLKEVPVNVIKPQSDVQRLVQQFHIQEQHENWTNTEKAMALLALSEATEMGIKELCATVGIAERSALKYMAFGDIIDKEKFTRNKVSLDWAEDIQALKKYTRNIKQNTLGKPFTREDEKALENLVIHKLNAGEFTRRRDITKLKDSFKKDPKSIDIALKDPDITAVELFERTGARGAFHLRNLHNHALWTISHGNSFMKLKDVKVTKEQLAMFKEAKTVLGQVIDMVE